MTKESWCPENDLVWQMEQNEIIALAPIEENRKLRARLAEVEAQSVHIYNSGYHAGHHDTVEGRYVDIHPSDMASYHIEEVAELREALAKLEEK